MRILRAPKGWSADYAAVLAFWLSVILLAVSGACGVFTPSEIASGEQAEFSEPDPLTELAKLDPFAERYRVDQVLKRIDATLYNPERGFSFVVWGDSRSNAEVCKRLWREIQKEKVLFAIHTGDIVSRGRVNDWVEYFFPIIDRYRAVPFLPAIGNHDLGTNRMEYKRIFGWLDYAFDYGNARFVVIDNNDGVSDEQLDWMERVLKAADKHKFVIAHKPPETIEKWAYHSFSEGADAFCDLMAECNVTTAFFGHIHAYSTAKYNAVDYVVTGGGGAPLHSRYGPMGNVHHYCVVHVKRGDVSHNVVRLIDGVIARSASGNEFYQHPRELLTPEVLGALKTIAPEAVVDDVDIEKEGGHTFFEVELEAPLETGDSRELQIVIREDGQVMQTEREVFREELPATILNYIRAHHLGEKFDEAVKVQDGEDSWYEVKLEKRDGSDRDLLFKLDGTFIAED